MADPAENAALSSVDLEAVRRCVWPLIGALDNQGGAHPIVTIHHGEERCSSMVAARVRELRRLLWPAPAEYAHLFGPYAPRTAESEAERRAVRARLWPEPARGAQ